MNVVTADAETDRALGRRFVTQVLEPMKSAFVGKDEVIDLMGVCLAARENLFILGPPGTAKSALVQDLARRLEGHVFDYLLTRFTEPNELFGPFDIRKLREGELVTNTEGMLPEASFVFLDELLNANSAILNSLLLVLNERVFRRGRETRALPTLMVVGASNHLPEDEALGALFDRFLLRVRCDNVAQERLADVLTAGWKLDFETERRQTAIGLEELRQLQSGLQTVDLAGVRPLYLETVHRLRHAGIQLSDRRAVKLQRLIAASALLCGRQQALASDLWVLRYIWDTDEQREVLASLVQPAVERCDAPLADRHPRSHPLDAPNPETIARDLERIAERLSTNLEPADLAYVQDQLGVLAGRCEWVEGAEQRTWLSARVKELWARIRERQP